MMSLGGREIRQLSPHAHLPLITRLRYSPAFTAQSHGWYYRAAFSIDGDHLD